MLDDGSERLVDHFLLGTGYRVEISQYRFLAPTIVLGNKLTGGISKAGGRVPQFDLRAAFYRRAGRAKFWGVAILCRWNRFYFASTYGSHLPK
jgi:hypothetical protein